jgi:hypothetical protein
MAFRIQHPDNGLFWTMAESVVLGAVSNASVYEVSCGNHIRNVETGLCVRHRSMILYEQVHGSPEYDFEYTINADGTIETPFGDGHFVGCDGATVLILKEGAVKWNIVI